MHLNFLSELIRYVLRLDMLALIHQSHVEQPEPQRQPVLKMVPNIFFDMKGN